ncbi:MAG: DUF4230 domain-containing protein [Syntrophales bacterium]|nr:DUF4230 domain-containing protein [Syntrophales bacterium]
MGDMFLGIIFGVFFALVIVFLFRFLRRKSSAGLSVNVHASIEDIRSVGELVVFKIITKEIVTTAEHWFGQWGKKYFQWLASTKKMAMIFEFEIDFCYNLRGSDFDIETIGPGSYKLKMPKCFYRIYIKDISFYDEQEAKLLPWLVPDLLNRAFGSGFSEEDKNHLKEEARNQAAGMAEDFALKMQSEVQSSARQTLEALAKAFGASRVVVDFSDSKLVQTKLGSAA